MSDNDEIAWTITWSGDIPVAIIFSKEHAAQAAQIAVETDLKNPLYLCVNLPKAAYSAALASASNSLMRISLPPVIPLRLQDQEPRASGLQQGQGGAHSRAPISSVTGNFCVLSLQSFSSRRELLTHVRIGDIRRMDYIEIRTRGHRVSRRSVGNPRAGRSVAAGAGSALLA